MKKVLLVEDDDDVREMLRLSLEDGGYEVVEACHGADAVTLLDQGCRPDVFIIDGQMPVMTGTELRVWLGASPHAATPIIVFSATTAARDLTGAARTTRLLPKGRDPAELLTALAIVLQSPPQPAAPSTSSPPSSPSSPSPSPSPSPAAASVASPAGRPQVLLVDDDRELIDLARELLEHAGYNVAVAVGGQQALDVLQLEPLPALIVLDLMMPLVSGWDVWDQLKAAPGLRHIPVIVWTASGLSQGAVGDARVVQKGRPEHLLVAVRELAPLRAVRST